MTRAYLQRLAVTRVQRSVRVRLASVLRGLARVLVVLAIGQLVNTSEAGFSVSESRHVDKS